MPRHSPSSDAPVAFARLAWVVLAATVAVVVSGDIVQATESGAGCGEGWPRCDGALVPAIEDTATGIEFAHRAATFVLSALVAALYIFSRRAFARSHRIRGAMQWVVALLVLEVAIGAVLVAFGWVEDDASVGRVIADGIHVVNTFFLVAGCALVVHYARGGAGLRLRSVALDDPLLAGGLLVLVAVAVTGAINSLADTLFPAETVLEGIRDEFGSAAPFLLRIRAVHPITAILGGTTVFWIARRFAGDGMRPAMRGPGLLVQYLVGAQFVIGILNLALLTPLETQVLHLLGADLLWIAFLFLTWASVVDRDEEPVIRLLRRAAL